VEKYEQGVDARQMFEDARAELHPRPWAIDKCDEFLARIGEPGKGGYKKAIIFTDNAGADVVLGIIPFARELLKRGCDVVLAANEIPSINDITVKELMAVMDEACSLDEILRDCRARGSWRLVSSGNDLPVIDLRNVSEEVAREAEDADLIVLEGMGRGIETNLFARFKVDSLKLAMVKHKEVADCLRTTLYDCVCQFLPGVTTDGTTNRKCHREEQPAVV
jgi:damage-control phosphatase, subfamily II, stand-alone protein